MVVAAPERAQCSAAQQAGFHAARGVIVLGKRRWERRPHFELTDMPAPSGPFTPASLPGFRDIIS